MRVYDFLLGITIGVLIGLSTPYMFHLVSMLLRHCGNL